MVWLKQYSTVKSLWEKGTQNWRKCAYPLQINWFRRTAIRLQNQTLKTTHGRTGNACTSSQWASPAQCHDGHTADLYPEQGWLHQLKGLCSLLPAFPAQGLDLLVHTTTARAKAAQSGYLHKAPSLYRHRLNWLGSSFTSPAGKKNAVIWNALPPQISCPLFWLHSSHLSLHVFIVFPLISYSQNALVCSTSLWPRHPL